MKNNVPENSKFYKTLTLRKDGRLIYCKEIELSEKGILLFFDDIKNNFPELIDENTQNKLKNLLEK